MNFRSDSQRKAMFANMFSCKNNSFARIDSNLFKTNPSKFTGVELDDLRAVISGDKDVAFVQPQMLDFGKSKKLDYDNLLEEATDKGFKVRYITNDTTESADDGAIVGLPGAVDDVHELMTTSNPNDDYSYHRRLGRLLGYSEDDIDEFESRIGKQKDGVVVFADGVTMSIEEFQYQFRTGRLVL